jgi:hypothetical protein
MSNGNSLYTSNGRFVFTISENITNQSRIQLGTNSIPTTFDAGVVSGFLVTPSINVGSAAGFLMNSPIVSSTSSQTLYGMRLSPTFTATHSNITTRTFETTVGGINGTVSFRLGTDFSIGVSSGTNRTSGTASLSGTPGIATINNTLVTNNSLILLTKQNATNVSSVVVTSRTPGVSFSVQSTSAGADTDIFGWLIIEPI